ncbi:12194_t:CDS:1, partial [Funneliformis mosseae]
MASSFGQIQNGEEVMPVVMMPTVDEPNSVIDQLNNEVGQAFNDLD